MRLIRRSFTGANHRATGRGAGVAAAGRTLLLTAIVLVLLACDDSQPVYICASKHAIRYHYSATCRGLANCIYRVKHVTLAEARKEGKNALPF